MNSDFTRTAGEADQLSAGKAEKSATLRMQQHGGPGLQAQTAGLTTLVVLGKRSQQSQLTVTAPHPVHPAVTEELPEPPPDDLDKAALAKVETSPLNLALNASNISLKGFTSDFFIFAISVLR